MKIEDFKSKIEHVVVLMLENRSFDHVLGSLSMDEGRPDFDGLKEEYGHAEIYKNRLYEALPFSGTEYADRARVFEFDPPHDWPQVAQQLSGKFIAAHASKHPTDPYPQSVLCYLTREDQPITYFLADNFVVCDRWFSAAPTQTMPNRFYALCGKSDFKSNPGGGDLFIQTPTIFDYLDDEDWHIYADHPMTLSLFKSAYDAAQLEKRRRRLSTFVKDAEAGKLRRFSWIAPRFSWTDKWYGDVLWPGTANDDHPPSDVAEGQKLIRRIYSALTANRTTWAKTLFILTYDEHGGFYDHVAPAPLEPNEQAHGFSTRGPRVPALLISPYTQTQKTYHGVLDHCSVLRLVRDWRELDAFETPRIDSPTAALLVDALLDQAKQTPPKAPELTPAPSAPIRYASSSGGPVPARPPVRDSNGRLFDALAEKILDAGEGEAFGLKPAPAAAPAPAPAPRRFAAAASKPERAVELAFVDLASQGHARPKQGVAYRLVTASSDELEALETPVTQYKRLDIDLFGFYSADLPEFLGSPEGMIKMHVDTRDPQNLSSPPTTAGFVTEFVADEDAYAPTFLYRGVVRNVLLEESANLGIDLYEIDTDAIETYDKVKKVINKVPELKSLDVLAGIPYIGLAAKLFDGLVRTFGRNPDDHLWGEIPILSINPLVGGAFLRSGIYVLFEREHKHGVVSADDLAYQDGQIYGHRLTNHLVFGLRLRPFTA